MLQVLKYLWEKSDEEHPVSNQDLMDHLNAEGITVTRKTLAADLKELTDFGIDIITNRGERNQYFIGDRGLDVTEVKLLVDAVEASHFLSRSKTNQLETKLSHMVSENQRREIRHDLYEGNLKSRNERVLITTDKLFTAIRNHHQVRFKLRRYTKDKEAGLANNGNFYDFSPFEMVYSGDNYYVFGFSEKHGALGQFRVDRIQDLRELDRPSRERPGAEVIKSHIREMFSMFSGEKAVVTLSCENAMMDHVIDRFGEEVTTFPIDSEHFGAKAEVELSPLFYSWVIGFGGKIRISAPAKAVEGFRELLKKFD